MLQMEFREIFVNPLLVSDDVLIILPQPVSTIFRQASRTKLPHLSC
jgi:hypothetical protein